MSAGQASDDRHRQDAAAGSGLGARLDPKPNLSVRIMPRPRRRWPAIRGPITARVGRLAREDSHDLAPEHHRDAVAQGEDVVELLADKQDGAALLALAQELAMHEFDDADIDPRVGWLHRSR